LKANGVYWSDVYEFYTANAPGITAATRYETPDGQKFVVGVDLTLEHLSRFLAGLKIGKTGRALIVDRDGRIIAHPQMQSALETINGELATKRVDEIGDVPAARAYDYFHANGPGSATITIDGVRYLARLVPLTAVGRNWSTMIVLPEDDFVGFVGRNNRTSLLMSLAIVGLAALMAGLLIRQGLRTDRAARLLRERGASMARQREALDRIADKADLHDPSHPELPQSLTEAAAEITGARRASLWYLLPNGHVLHCADSFDSEAARHSAGFELHRDELPHFFHSVTEGGALDVADAAGDPRTAEVHRLLMAPLGGRSLSITPMRRRGQAVGGVWLEDAPHAATARDFLRVLAGMAAQRATETATGTRPADSETGERPAEPEIARSASPDLTLGGFDHEKFGDNLYPRVAVLVVRIEESVAAENGDVSPPELIDAVIRAMQEIAAGHDLPYLKLVGCDIVGAAGFAADDPTSAARVANTAIAGRDRLTELFEAHGRTPNFRVGVDCGVGVGATIGAAPRVFNLWGSATQTARVMAESALPGSIQISEAAYEQLRRNFLLRPRGTFFQPGVGRAQTFVLAGRL
jgi:class 3 adenylate cyclase